MLRYHKSLESAKNTKRVWERKLEYWLYKLKGIKGKPYSFSVNYCTMMVYILDGDLLNSALLV